MVTSLIPNSLVVLRTRTWICISVGNVKAGFTLGDIYSAKAGGAEHKTATNNSKKHNRVKNSQLAGGKPFGQSQSCRTTENKSSWRSERDLNSELEFHRSHRLTTPPSYLLHILSIIKSIVTQTAAATCIIGVLIFPFTTIPTRQVYSQPSLCKAGFSRSSICVAFQLRDNVQNLLKHNTT